MKWVINMAWTISDSWRTEYIRALKDAVSNERDFYTFRANPGINQIFESVSEEQGNIYHRALIELLKTFPNDIDINKLLVDDDRFKKRFVTEYNGHKISPNLFRYAYTACNVIKHFGYPTHIVEIGGGFGGLVSIFDKLHFPVHYTIIDIPEALALQEKYLKAINCKLKIKFIESSSQLIAAFPVLKDFVTISCYALDELDKEERQFYYDKVLRCSNGVYLTVSQTNVPGSYTEEVDPVAGKILWGKP